MNPRFGRYVPEILPHRLHRGIATSRIHYCAIANDVVGDDQRTGMRESERPLPIIRIARLVRIDENEIESTRLFGDQVRQCIQSCPKANVDDFRHTGSCKVCASNVYVVRLRLKRYNTSARR